MGGDWKPKMEIPVQINDLDVGRNVDEALRILKGPADRRTLPGGMDAGPADADCAGQGGRLKGTRSTSNGRT